MHHQHRLSVLQWNPGPARRNPTQNIAATFGRLGPVVHTGNSDLAILLNRDTFEPNPAVHAFQEASTSKDTRGMVVSWYVTFAAPFPFRLSHSHARDAPETTFRLCLLHIPEWLMMQRVNPQLENQITTRVNPAHLHLAHEGDTRPSLYFGRWEVQETCGKSRFLCSTRRTVGCDCFQGSRLCRARWRRAWANLAA